MHVHLITRALRSRNALLLLCLLTSATTPLLAKELPKSTAFPGTFWLSAGDVGPVERGNSGVWSGVEQGITVWQRGAWFAIPYVGATLSNDSAGYEWNDRHPGQIGAKLVWRVSGGALQAGGGLMFEHDPIGGGDRHPTAFVSYWTGWAAEGSAQRGSMLRGLPGHFAATSGLMTGRDPDNWMTRIDGQQGVVVVRNRIFSLVPYGGGVVTFDSKRRVWENRVTLDGGIKAVKTFVGGVVEGGIAERRQYTVLTGEVGTAPVAFVNVWFGWNPRAVSQR